MVIARRTATVKVSSTVIVKYASKSLPKENMASSRSPIIRKGRKLNLSRLSTRMLRRKRRPTTRTTNRSSRPLSKAIVAEGVCPTNRRFGMC